jgi:hypothetical protein
VYLFSRGRNRQNDRPGGAIERRHDNDDDLHGDVMTTQQRQEPFGQAPTDTIASLQRLMSAPVSGLRHQQLDRGPGGPEEQWQDHLRILQQWICELLFKNQQLRMSLEAALAPERED